MKDEITKPATEQEEIKKSIKNILSNDSLSRYIIKIAQALTKINTKHYSKWKIAKVVIRHTLFDFQFWTILIKNFKDIITLQHLVHVYLAVVLDITHHHPLPARHVHLHVLHVIMPSLLIVCRVKMVNI